MNLITFGSSKFSVPNKSDMDSMINEVLSTAGLLNINITNYVLDLGNDVLLVLNPMH